MVSNTLPVTLVALLRSASRSLDYNSQLLTLLNLSEFRTENPDAM
jgi:hypothetical protein